MSVTSPHRYWEDFARGQQITHRRGHTVSEVDNQVLSLLTMNTAQTHFNVESLASYMGGAFDRPLLNACVALALAVGLTSEDMSENMVSEMEIDGFRMPAPVFQGDTLYARSTVLEVRESPDRADAGLLTYDIDMRNAEQVTVVTARRTVLLKKRAAWADSDSSAHEDLFARATARLRRTARSTADPSGSPPLR